jgi:hypothetical protein
MWKCSKSRRAFICLGLHTTNMKTWRGIHVHIPSATCWRRRLNLYQQPCVVESNPLLCWHSRLHQALEAYSLHPPAFHSKSCSGILPYVRHDDATVTKNGSKLVHNSRKWISPSYVVEEHARYACHKTPNLMSRRCEKHTCRIHLWAAYADEQTQRKKSCALRTWTCEHVHDQACRT